MSQVNLLPPDILRAQRLRRLTGVIAIGCAVLLLLILAFYFVQVNKLAGIDDQIAAQEATNASIQVDVDSLQKYATLQETAQAQEKLLAEAYSGEVSFSAMLMDVSRVIPSDVDLNDLTVRLTAVDAAAATTTPAPTTPTGGTTLIGSLSGTGTGANIDTLANFLTRMETVKGWANPWISTLARTPETGFVDYTIGVDITSEAITPRGGGSSGA
jgi:Tfp pilus assembly protein PilN